jgi:AmmeMemoRadiSam system protein A
MYNPSEKKWLLELARKSIGHYLEKGAQPKVEPFEVPERLRESAGCFVTLTVHGRLRGCIGHIEAIQPLYKDVIDNAISAAFDDPRFPPLDSDELKKVEIEVSVLSKPKELVYENAEDLLRKLKPRRDGVILRKGSFGATFLPQVWDELKKPEDFLSHLCAKAGLPSEEWRKGSLAVQSYTVEAFDESATKA